MEKIFVKSTTNKVPLYNHEFFRKGDTVIVIDGSYMTEHGKKGHVTGSQFTGPTGRHELLTVTSINVPRRTSSVNENFLVRQNNCQITGGDGRVYNCSHINIRRWED